MDVVGHQAIAGCGDAVELAEDIEVRTVVTISEEHILVLLSRIAALNIVVRLTWNYDSGHARQAHNALLAGRKVNE